MAFKILTVKLHAERDADILEWLQQQENVSLVVRSALRAYIEGEQNGRSGIDEALLRRILREELARVSIVPSGDGRSPAQEDEETAEMLDSLLGTYDVEASGEED